MTTDHLLRLIGLALVCIGLALFAASCHGAEPEHPAYAAAYATGKPFLVVVSARWCSACQTLKRTYAEFGVCYVEVDVDRQPATASLFDHQQIPRVYLVAPPYDRPRRVQVEVKEVP